MLSNQIDKSAVRIYDTRTKIAGCGFFLAGCIITCAHVVKHALGIAHNSTTRPLDIVSFDFPLLNSRTILAGRVNKWFTEADVTSLEILSPLPENISAPRLIKADNLWGHSFRAYGFPRGHDEGVWASGRILHKVSNGWLEIEDVKQTGLFVQPGFSGGAIWDEEYHGIVGMVIGSDANLQSRVAYVIPTNKLIELFPEIEEYAVKPIDIDLQIITELLNLGLYSEAYQKCSKVLLIVPQHPVINLLGALSLLRGMGADKHRAVSITRAEKHLSIVCYSTKYRPTALAILGIIKYDSYYAHGLDEGSPSMEEIRRELQTYSNQVDTSFFNLIKASEAALAYLDLR